MAALRDGLIGYVIVVAIGMSLIGISYGIKKTFTLRSDVVDTVETVDSRSK